ncbi:hypothetical protein PCASD_10382 [Puccinia coronata f. sp. avenae]|uniref:Uncharacterized protein n=1 Tax=Puccinia coronata f. sp. avenae TaxID=200324 RepID=A0A2N5URR8_9BASI|nr:hypothetical protein PCASD_10382 [Puccinia coronata f. sp. avenae]
MLTNNSASINPSQQGVPLDQWLCARRFPSQQRPCMVAASLVPASAELAAMASLGGQQRSTKAARQKAKSQAKSRKTGEDPSNIPLPSLGPADDAPDTSILDILGSSEMPGFTQPLKHSHTDISPAPSMTKDEATTKSEEVLALAMLNKSLGKPGRAEMLFRIYKKMLDKLVIDDPTSTAPAAASTLVPSKRSSEAPATSNGEKKSRGPLFNPEKCNCSTNLVFTQYFDRNIREMWGPIPLTIFDQKWQAAALAYQTEKRPSQSKTSGEKSGCYNGYPYPSEWSLTAGEWERLYRSFDHTLREVYNFNLFCDWLATHKRHVDGLLNNKCFMVALRYNIWVRANAFAVHIHEEEDHYVTNIGKWKQDIANQCYATAVKFGEISFTDNPYAFGGTRAGWDPLTGKPKPTKARNNQPFADSGGDDKAKADVAAVVFPAAPEVLAVATVTGALAAATTGPRTRSDWICKAHLPVPF